MRKAFSQKENLSRIDGLKQNTPMIKKIEMCSKTNTLFPSMNSFVNETIEDLPYVDCDEIIVANDFDEDRIKNIEKLMFINVVIDDSIDGLWCGEETQQDYSEQSPLSVGLL